MDERGDEEKNLSSESTWGHVGRQRGERWLSREQPVKSEQEAGDEEPEQGARPGRLAKAQTGPADLPDC